MGWNEDGRGMGWGWDRRGEWERGMGGGEWEVGMGEGMPGHKSSMSSLEGAVALLQQILGGQPTHAELHHALGISHPWRTLQRGVYE